MHHIYHTEGFILGSKSFGEASKYYYIFTRELGMIYASASGVRKVSSKLRFVLQDFAYVRVDLVQGKDFWRITSASKTSELEDIVNKPSAFAIYSRISVLLRRLLAGVEANEALFSDVLEGLKILEKLEKSDDLENMEIVLVFRILYNLGYIGTPEVFESLVHMPVSESMLPEVSKKRKQLLVEINKAIRETQLY